MKSILMLLVLSTISLYGLAQGCKNICVVTMTETSTKKVLKGTYLVEIKTGWEVWTYTGQANYKSKENLSTFFALVKLPTHTAILKAHKGTGPSLIWSGASPSVNCDVFPWGSFAVSDVSGNRGTIKLASY